MPQSTGMRAVVDGVRRIIMRWVVTRTELTVNAMSGDTSIKVKSTRRFKVGDQFLIHNTAEDMENQLYVRAVPDKETILIGDAEGNPKALRFNWPLSAGGNVVKTQNDQFIKGVFFGEPAVITDLPAITVSLQNRSSEPFTFRSTKERYNLEIAAYVSGTTQEEGDEFLTDLMETIQYGLKRNFYPLLNDYKTLRVTADIEQGDTHIKVNATDLAAIMSFTEPNRMAGSNQIIIEDEYNIEVHSITTVCDSTTIQIAQPIGFDFKKEDAIIIKPNRLPFNSWPSDVKFGLIKKGTMLKAATISYFIEEMEDHPDASFGDTQLR